METAFRSDERFTQSEFLDWLDKRPPGDVNHYELLDGHVVTTPPASWKHSSVGANIVTELVLHARSTGTGRAFDATAGYGLPSGDVLEPDASFVSTATLPRDQSRQPDTFLRIVPDFVVEILSPSTSRRSLIARGCGDCTTCPRTCRTTRWRRLRSRGAARRRARTSCRCTCTAWW